jgi:KDO2-lipid IV(A) lauroyltransferase
VVTTDPHNPKVDAWLRRERSRWGVRPFDRRREALAAARWLASGRPLALAADHRTAVASLPAPWFGRVAPTPRGVAWLARRAGARIVAVGIRRHDGEHEVWIGDEVAVGEDRDEAAIAACCNAAIEGLIRRAPEEWTWFHDRYDLPAL